VRAGALAVLLFFAAAVAPAAASGSRRPPAPPAGFNVDVARIEPSAADRFVHLDGPDKPPADFRGALELRRTDAGVGAVNDVALEDYLKGIGEVPRLWPMQALEAQVVAARSYALAHMAYPDPTGEALGYQLCATDFCQVYTGLAVGDGPYGDRWRKAVIY